MAAVGWLVVVSEQVGANHQSHVQSGSAASLRRSPPSARLGVVLLARSVDVVEERHGEGHAQQLWRKKGRSSELLNTRNVFARVRYASPFFFFFDAAVAAAARGTPQ